ncbi:MAG: hypothetical protein IJI36_08900, partial [Kiritimatiellae bacterium]|nr:hypothetical protein [Kiritimatiellia bacterium]
ADVEANDVTVSADANVTLNGAGKLGGPGTIVKTGAGTFTFNATGGFDAQPIIVSNGVFKMGADLTGPLGATADSAPIIVADGGALDVNFNDTNAAHVARSKVTREKLVRVAGEGPDGRGAIVNDRYNSYYTFSDMVLDDDATMGGTKRFDVRGGQTAYARNAGSIYGPGKTLTVKNTTAFGIVNSAVTLDAIVVTNGGTLQIEGNGNTWNVTDGIRLRDGGTLNAYGNYAYPANLSITADSGTNVIRNTSGTSLVNGPIVVAPGATLLQNGGSIRYGGTITGTFDITNGSAFLDGALKDGFTQHSAMTGNGNYRIRQNGTFSNVDLACRQVGIADVSNSTVNVTFLDSTLDISRLFLGWGTAWMNAYLSIGEGTELTAGLINIGYTGVATNKTESVLSVDGGTIHHTGTEFAITEKGPHADFVLNAGTVTVDKAAITLRKVQDMLGGYNTARFIQNGGTFNYGGTGFTSPQAREDNTDNGFIVLTGGAFNATNNWSIPYFIPLFFGYAATDGWTLNQADGTTATWTTALHGNGDVTLNGAATLVGTNEIQGVVGGKWTVGDGFTAGLEGAASFLGGLALGEGATATIDVATNRSAVFTARDGGDKPTGANGVNCITNRFNRAIGGTTRGTITHDETFLFTYYTPAASRPFGNMHNLAAYAVGDFYVDEVAAGKWIFAGACDDCVQLWIDGELALATGQTEVIVTNELAAGWHSFRHIAMDNTGSFGRKTTYGTIGFKNPVVSAYKPFCVTNVTMRPAADFGDPNNANTVRWSHYKGTAAKVGSKVNLLWKDADFDWDFCCITNNLQMLTIYSGSTSANAPWFNGYTVNRYDGWFLVTEENADKDWTFRTQYDDCCALWIDGTDTGLIGTNNNARTETYTTTLGRGWHSFRIQTVDFSGSAGPWSGNGIPVSYKVGDGAQTFFSEETLQLTVCPDGYVQGGVTLASGARLANGAAENAATVFGDVAATGTGATLAGPFKFAGGTLAFRNVAPNTADLANVLAFEDAAPDMLADVDAIVVDYASTPTRGRIPVCQLYGLTEEAAKAKLSVTVSGAPADHVVVKVENGVLTIRNTKGTMLLFR